MLLLLGVMLLELISKQKYLVLSGGLGSSHCVQTRLREAFVGTQAHKIAPGLEILAAQGNEP